MKKNKKYYLIEPESAGTLGNNTERDVTVHPPIIKKLHYVIENWLGDDIIEAFPAFLVSEKLKKLLKKADLKGSKITDCEITLSDNYKELTGEEEIPKFYWLKIIGSLFDNSDFYINHKHHLVVSDDVSKLLINMNVDNCNLINVYQDWENITVKYNVYDISLTNLKKALIQKYKKDHSVVKSYNQLIEISLDVSEDFKRADETYLPNFVVTYKMDVFQSLFAYKLISEPKKTSLILDHHFKEYSYTEKKEFLNTIEHQVFNLIDNFKIGKDEKKEIQEKIVKWVRQKRKDINDTSKIYVKDVDTDKQTEGVEHEERIKILTDVFLFYAKKNMKFNDTYIGSNIEDIGNIIRLHFKKNPNFKSSKDNTNQNFIIWKGAKDHLYHIIFLLAHHPEIDSRYNVLEFSDWFCTDVFKDKNNKRITKDEIYRGINKYEQYYKNPNENLIPKPSQKHKGYIDKLLKDLPKKEKL